MKIIKMSIFVILWSIFIVSCKETKYTFGDLNERQKWLIQWFIEQEKLEILDKYPDSGVFGEKQFVRLDNGCYLNVVDSGNGKKAIADQTVILMQCSATDLANEKNTFMTSSPIKFTYGKAAEVIPAMSDKTNSQEYRFLSVGVESALKFVGENAKVRMIVPFMFAESNAVMVGKDSWVGSSYQLRNNVPFYYSEITFQFEAND